MAQPPKIFKLVFWLVILASFLVAVPLAVDPDMGWHLRVGQNELASGSVPRLDAYSYTMPGHEWIDHEWLVDAWLSWMNSRGLWSIVILIFSFLAALPFFFWLRRSASWIHSGLIVLVAAVMTSFVGVRPQIISFAVFFAVFEILLRLHDGAPAGRKLTLLLPPIFFVWANLHAGFFLGLAVFAIFVALEFVAEWRKSGKVINGKTAFYAVVLIASFLATVLNPYGLKLYGEIFAVMFSQNTMKYISEWRSVFDFAWIDAAALIGVFLFFLIKFPGKYKSFLGAASVILFLLFLKSVRNGPLFFVAAAPFFAVGIEALREHIPQARPDRPPLRRADRIVKAIGFAVLILFISFLVFKVVSIKSPPVPDKAVDFLKREAASGERIVLLNGYDWGGYLILHAPQIKVFIDGRMPHWTDVGGNSAMADYVKAFYQSDNQDAWQEVFRRRGVNTVLMSSAWGQTHANSLEQYLGGQLLNYYGKSFAARFAVNVIASLVGTPARNLKSLLLENGWHVVYEDDVAIILRCVPDSCIR
jgi:hypothetical protein